MIATCVTEPNYFLKSLKPTKLVAKPHIFFKPPPCNKVSPIPIVYKSFPNAHDFRSKLVKHGHKFISEMIFSNEDAPATLNKIKRSSTLKHIRSIQFDPYLCNDSGIRELCQVLPKLKGASKVDLVIRRVSKENETDMLCPLLRRIRRMKKLKMEFPGTDNINEKGWMNLAKAMVKCHSLRSLNYQLIGVAGATSRSDRCFTDIQRKNPQIEELSVYNKTRKGVLRSDIQMDLNRRNRKPRNPKLRTFKTTCVMSLGWTISNSTCIECVLSHFKNVKQMSIVSFSHPIDSDDVFRMMKTISMLQNLERLSMELSNNIGDQEAMAMCLGIKEMTQLKHFTFKAIKTMLTKEGILQFVAFLCKRQHLKGFDLFLSRFNYLNVSIEELARRILEANPVVKCVPSKQSIHIFKS